MEVNGSQWKSMEVKEVKDVKDVKEVKKSKSSGWEVSLITTLFSKDVL